MMQLTLSLLKYIWKDVSLRGRENPKRKSKILCFTERKSKKNNYIVETIIVAILVKLHHPTGYLNKDFVQSLTK